MLIEITERGNHIVARFAKDIMMSNTTEFGEEFDIILQKKPVFLSLDFRDVKFVDSSGIGSLINLVTQLKKEGTVISVFNMHKSLFSVFKLSGLYHIMELYQDAEDFYKKFPEWKENS